MSPRDATSPMQPSKAHCRLVQERFDFLQEKWIALHNLATREARSLADFSASASATISYSLMPALHLGRFWWIRLQTVSSDSDSSRHNQRFATVQSRFHRRGGSIENLGDFLNAKSGEESQLHHARRPRVDRFQVGATRMIDDR